MRQQHVCLKYKVVNYFFDWISSGGGSGNWWAISYTFHHALEFVAWISFALRFSHYWSFDMNHHSNVVINREFHFRGKECGGWEGRVHIFWPRGINFMVGNRLINYPVPLNVLILWTGFWHFLGKGVPKKLLFDFLVDDSLEPSVTGRYCRLTPLARVEVQRLLNNWHQLAEGDCVHIAVCTKGLWQPFTPFYQLGYCGRSWRGWSHCTVHI